MHNDYFSVFTLSKVYNFMIIWHFSFSISNRFPLRCLLLSTANTVILYFKFGWRLFSYKVYVVNPEPVDLCPMRSWFDYLKCWLWRMSFPRRSRGASPTAVIIPRVSEVIMFSPCVFVITRDSEVIMFSPCVFVCVWVSMFVTMFVRTI